MRCKIHAQDYIEIEFTSTPMSTFSEFHSSRCDGDASSISHGSGGNELLSFSKFVKTAA